MISQNKWFVITSYFIIFIFINMIIPLSLFPCFFSGFLTYEIIISLSSYFERYIKIHLARKISAMLIIICIITIFSTGIINCTNFFTEDISTIDILTEINRIFSDLKKSLPNSFSLFVPETTEELKNQIFSWIESNIILIRNMGHTFIHGFFSLFIGLIVGILIACTKSNIQHTANNTYFVIQLLMRIHTLSQAFRNIVFAQIKISSVNTLLTFIMIFIFFPLFEQSLPLKKTLIIITFILGLLPIVGNVVSNILITIAALSISLSAGTIMFIYLILIHKLEYFLNAEIIGSRINANPWELILSMLILESIFGIEGLIAAPIYYAYLKTELRLQHMI